MERRNIMNEIRDVARQSADIRDLTLTDFRNMGFTKRQVERAVANGVLQWTRYGDLTLVESLSETMKHQAK